MMTIEQHLLHSSGVAPLRRAPPAPAMTYFREIQPIWQNRVAWLAFLPALSGGYSLWTINRLSEGNPPATAMVAAVASIALSLWLIALRLETEVAEDALRLRFRFLWFPKQIEFRSIRHAEAVDYKALRSYGGWGIRRGKQEGRPEWAWMISGSRGVRLHFHDGDTFLLGSRRADELASAINSRIPTIREPRTPSAASN